jgi:hypothetical protein
MRYLLSLFLVFTIFSCSNDLEVYSPEKKIDYVYGTLNVRDSVHKVIVRKTVKKNSSKAEFDELYYADDEISVFLEEYSGETKVKEYEYFPVVSTEEGKKTKYYQIDKLSLKDANKYSLRIDKADGQASIKNERPFYLEKRLIYISPNYISKGDFKVRLFLDEPSLSSFKWKQPGGGLEQLYFVMAYEEHNKSTGARDTIYTKTSLFNEIPDNDEPGALLRYNKAVSALLLSLEGRSEHANIKRSFLSLEKHYQTDELVAYTAGIEAYTLSKDLTTYNDITFGTDNLNQEPLTYSNLENAVGMFSSISTRIAKVKDKRLYFDRSTMNGLACHEAMKKYNFPVYLVDKFNVVTTDYEGGRCLNLK